MKRLSVILALALGASAVVMIGGFITKDRTKYSNDFVRIFPPHAADFKSARQISDTVQFMHDSGVGYEGYAAARRISNTSVILQSMNFRTKENSLTKSTGGHPHVLKKQVDGLLCTDGILDYSSELALVVYTYRYRNQYVCLDTNLNLVKFGKTIDTTSVAKISVSELQGKITMAKPPLMVNRDARIHGRYLFVYSNLMAANESIDNFRNNSVVDVYDLSDGSYHFSFYIANYHNIKMQQFKVTGSIFTARFGDMVVQYDLPSQYFP